MSSTFFLNPNGLSYTSRDSKKNKEYKSMACFLLFPFFLTFTIPPTNYQKSNSFILNIFIEYLHAPHTVLGAWDISINKRQKTQRQ